MGDLFYDTSVHFDVNVMPIDEVQSPNTDLVAEEIQRVLWNAACGTPWKAAISGSSPLTVTAATYQDQGANGLRFGVDVIMGTTVSTKQMYAFAEWITSVSKAFSRMYTPSPRTQSTMLVKVYASHEFKSSSYLYHMNPAIHSRD